MVPGAYLVGTWCWQVSLLLRNRLCFGASEVSPATFPRPCPGSQDSGRWLCLTPGSERLALASPRQPGHADATSWWWCEDSQASTRGGGVVEPPVPLHPLTCSSCLLPPTLWVLGPCLLRQKAPAEMVAVPEDDFSCLPSSSAGLLVFILSFLMQPEALVNHAACLVGECQRHAPAGVPRYP